MSRAAMMPTISPEWPPPLPVLLGTTAPSPLEDDVVVSVVDGTTATSEDDDDVVVAVSGVDVEDVVVGVGVGIGVGVGTGVGVWV